MLRADAQQTAGLTEFVCQDKTSKKHNELLFHAWVSTQYSVKAQCRVLLDLIVSLPEPFFSKTRCVRCCVLLCDAGCPSISQARVSTFLKSFGTWERDDREKSVVCPLF